MFIFMQLKLTNLIIIFDASVFPEPDSPEITIHVSFDARFMVCNISKLKTVIKLRFARIK